MRFSTLSRRRACLTVPAVPRQRRRHVGGWPYRRRRRRWRWRRRASSSRGSASLWARVTPSEVTTWVRPSHGARLVDAWLPRPPADWAPAWAPAWAAVAAATRGRAPRHRTRTCDRPVSCRRRRSTRRHLRRPDRRRIHRAKSSLPCGRRGWVEYLAAAAAAPPTLPVVACAPLPSARPAAADRGLVWGAGATAALLPLCAAVAAVAATATTFVAAHGRFATPPVLVRRRGGGRHCTWFSPTGNGASAKPRRNPVNRRLVEVFGGSERSVCGTTVPFIVRLSRARLKKYRWQRESAGTVQYLRPTRTDRCRRRSAGKHMHSQARVKERKISLFGVLLDRALRG